MAGSGILSRLSSSRLPSLSFKIRTNKSVMPTISPLKSSPHPQVSASVKPISRLPVELSCLMSMMPLHSAVASARLRSFLSMDSQSWGLVPQGISMPL
ncbi:protein NONRESPONDING TO OXYLIPINS 2, mitochondrial-like [Mangifera indica]|uniref:protein NONRESPONDING TO OXYLIPINS 2, mitochondrial-like n=1 Tax=Mangifera indica TaxID=29780 RepID=UPI001CF9FD28|nr:protein NONRESPONDING TO OXYLIPINS 2, mitochondrial-like [Mangifera indica]XP_044463411.1 protein NONRESPONDING TO OXYLIPINS 2, mitochondrial-like [Mangifera indica]XP_044463412.1 protein NONRESPONDING TO OXYLIPINS 2, mitochondrial-like [Mangifera indica]